MVEQSKHEVPVTIIIPAFNHQQYVEQSLLSAINQDYSNLEIIIIDDGSSDDTPAVIERVLANLSNERKITYISQRNKGLSRTLNIALKMATGEYVQFLASDDAYLPEKTRICASRLDALPESTGAVYCDGYVIDEDNTKLMKFSDLFLRPFSTNTRKELIIANWIPAIGILYRKNALLSVGGFDESLEVEDYDLLLRFTKRFRVASISDLLFLYRSHPTNFSKDSVRMKLQHNATACNHEDLRNYLSFLQQIKARSVVGAARHLSLLNCELFARALVRLFQDKCLRRIRSTKVDSSNAG